MGYIQVFKGFKLCVMICMAPLRGNIEERKKLWNDLDRVIDRIGNGHSLCMLGI